MHNLRIRLAGTAEIAMTAHQGRQPATASPSVGSAFAPDMRSFGRIIYGYKEAELILGRPTMPTEPSSAADRRPDRIGPYRILDTLGEGGMGTVYLAEQQEPVRRRVALKLIKLGMDSKAVLARFDAERQALALMAHDGIAKVYDCGTSERGQPFFVMELVKGIALTDFCDQRRLSLPDRLELLQQVCAAVTHAHQKGVVHRDLKPGNVLVSEDQGKVQIKIIDFGLAKAMGQKLVEATMFTEAGQVIGTPEYMAPEQAASTNVDIDTRADVYSLGVMLYEVLTGQLPFSAAELRQAGMLEMQRVLREQEPPKPSTKLSRVQETATAVAAQRRTSAAALQKALRNDLDWVVLKALEKDPARRYDTANALAADLQRFLQHEPLVAGPPSTRYRLKKLVRKYRGHVLTAGAVVMASLTFGGVALRQYWRAEEKTAETLIEKGKAQANEDLAVRRAEENARLATAAHAARQEVERQNEALEDRGRQLLESEQKLTNQVREFNLLALAMILKEARKAEQGLTPPWPSKVEAMERWLRDFSGPLARSVPRMRSFLSLRRMTAEAVVGALAIGLGRTTIMPMEPVTAQECTQQEAEDALDRTLKGLANRYLVETVGRLLEEVEEFQEVDVTRVEAQLRWARQIGELTMAHPQARHTWAAVRAAIAGNPKYAGQDTELRDQDITGLVPIGENPVTRLWEFYELRSAWDGQRDPREIPIPVHKPDGSIEMTGETGIVFVLLPGGTFTMGAQKVDPNGPNFDPGAGDDETPHQVSLSPFFLARHELTQGQWARLWLWEAELRDPSQCKAGGYIAGKHITLANPAEQVDWTMCDTLLTRHGLVLPTEAQWEYGCRGGTTTPWIVERDTLKEFANVADATAAKAGTTQWPCESWRDGHCVHAPVGSFSANAFGLHDVHGNVREWCMEWYGLYGADAAGEGLRAGRPSSFRTSRGGGFSDSAADARAANRLGFATSIRGSGLGARAARRIRP